MGDKLQVTALFRYWPKDPKGSCWAIGRLGEASEPGFIFAFLSCEMPPAKTSNPRRCSDKKIFCLNLPPIEIQLFEKHPNFARSMILPSGNLNWGVSEGGGDQRSIAYEDFRISCESRISDKKMSYLCKLLEFEIIRDTKLLLAETLADLGRDFSDDVCVCQPDGTIIASPWKRHFPRFGPIAGIRAEGQAITQELSGVTLQIRPLFIPDFPFSRPLYLVKQFSKVSLPKNLYLLTPCLKEVLSLILEGKTEEEMSVCRGVSKSTIRKQKYALLNALGYDSCPKLLAGFLAYFRMWQSANKADLNQGKTGTKALGRS